MPPGVEYMNTGGTVVAGTTEAYYKVNTIDSNGNGTITVNGTTYWVYGASIVRGYAKTFSEGQMYTIDRWMLTSADGSGNVNILIGDDYIEYNGVGNANFSEVIKGKFAGKTVTLTMLVKDATNCMFGIRNINTWEVFSGTSIPDGSGLVTITAAIPSDYAYDMIRVTISSGLSGENVPHLIKIKAVKLELGSQQTLAHQDENGNWVLNEIPNYAEELAKCQRYFTNIPYSIGRTISTAVSDGNGEAFFPIYFPTTMRVTPVFTHTGILRVHGPGIEYRDVSISTVTTQGNIVVLRVVGLSPLTTYALDSATGGVLNFSADL